MQAIEVANPEVEYGRFYFFDQHIPSDISRFH
jgi:hypothetical protein